MTPSTEEIARAFAGRTRGRVRTDRVTRELYSTDASPYRVYPAAVLVPEAVDDLHAAVEVCRGLGLSITPRGAGTSFTGPDRWTYRLRTPCRSSLACSSSLLRCSRSGKMTANIASVD